MSGINGWYLVKGMRPAPALVNCVAVVTEVDEVPLTLVFIFNSESLSSSVVLFGWAESHSGNKKTPALGRTGHWRTQYEAFALRKEEADQTSHGANVTQWVRRLQQIEMPV